MEASCLACGDACGDDCDVWPGAVLVSLDRVVVAFALRPRRMGDTPSPTTRRARNCTRMPQNKRPCTTWQPGRHWASWAAGGGTVSGGTGDSTVRGTRFNVSMYPPRYAVRSESSARRKDQTKDRTGGAESLHKSLRFTIWGRLQTAKQTTIGHCNCYSALSLLHCATIATLRYILGYMASARLRHWAAQPAKWAFPTGAGHSAAARSKCVAASLSSTAERGPDSQAPHIPPNTSARIILGRCARAFR